MSVSPATPTLRVSDLRIDVKHGGTLIDGVELEVAPGEILALVGESGSGKTTTALSLFGYLDRGLVMRSGDVSIAGERMEGPERFKHARGRLISYVPQNPGTALNPSLRVLDAVGDVINAHRRAAGADELAYDLLGRVDLPRTTTFGRRFPHQLSGGQQQRVCIATALAPEPSVVVLDEPTTGLDVVTQDRILKELARLVAEEQLAMLYITHDLAVVAQIAARIAVMYKGRIVEQGLAQEVLRRPRHPYTRALIAATPDHRHPRVLQSMRTTGPADAVSAGSPHAGCSFAPRCSLKVQSCEEHVPELLPISDAHLVRCPEWSRAPETTASAQTGRPTPGVQEAEPPPIILEVEDLRATYGSQGDAFVAIDGVSFAIPRGACVALVGESGSGKSTIGRVIAGLHGNASGRVAFHGEQLSFTAARRTIEQRRRLQLIFQNPAEALNPRHTVEDSIARPARTLRRLGRGAAGAEVRRLLDSVHLPASVASRYPAELSGGERQRVAIARALAAGPELIVCDEITSALDVSVQAVVIELLHELRAQLGVALVFITHDFGVVAAVADETLVLEGGRICERSATADLLAAPRHPYTQRLLAAAPSLGAAAWGEPEPAPLA